MDDVPLEDWIVRPHFDGALLVAPPGCGKTEALARRASHVVRAGLIEEPQQILALTYSRKATDNLSSRIRRHLGSSAKRHVVTTNFHRFATRLLHSHGNAIGRPADSLVAQSTSDQKRLLRSVANDYGMDSRELDRIVRDAKDGLYTDVEVLERLEARSAAALSFEEQLRATGAFDFTDQLRLGALILRNPCVRRLYQRRFPYMLVDEAQDVSMLQFEIIRRLSVDATVFAGDLAQGIFEWAGAAPDLVYPEIESRAAVRVTLSHSYRSAPAIINVVDWAGRELGGSGLQVAPDAEWNHEGVVSVERFADDGEEAERIASYCVELLDGSCSVGVLTRNTSRIRRLLAEFERQGVPHQNWDQAAQRPEVIALLRRHVSAAIRDAGDGVEGLDDLYYRCVDSVTAEDGETLMALGDAAEDLRDAVTQRGLKVVISQLQQVWDPDDPVPAGVHVSTAHKGKGQQFDHVIIVGLEEDSIPSYFARKEPDQEKAMRSELAVLHVMLSRPRHTLTLTCCKRVHAGSSLWRREPSRWLAPLEKLATTTH